MKRSALQRGTANDARQAMSQHDEERAMERLNERATAAVRGWNDGGSLVKRLRARARNTMIPHSIFDAAADEIERLRAALIEAASLMHNLPRSATADQAEKLCREAAE